jgi:hypothetical protein
MENSKLPGQKFSHLQRKLSLLQWLSLLLHLGINAGADDSVIPVGEDVKSWHSTQSLLWKYTGENKFKECPMEGEG